MHPSGLFSALLMAAARRWKNKALFAIQPPTINFCGLIICNKMLQLVQLFLIIRIRMCNKKTDRNMLPVGFLMPPNFAVRRTLSFG